MADDVKRSQPLAMPARGSNGGGLSHLAHNPSIERITNSPRSLPSFRQLTGSPEIHRSPKLSSSPRVHEERMKHHTTLTKDPSLEPKDEDSVADLRRRTVSDAAQWIRKRRQSDLQKELLLATATGARQHKFETGTTGKFCGVCQKVLFGLTRSLRCVDCGLEVHRGCDQLAPACLGQKGSLASVDMSNQQLTASLGVRLVRVCLSSASGLARKSIMRLPDPFAVVNIDGEQWQSAVSRKTLNPQWMTQRDMYMSPSSVLTIFVFDAKRFRSGQWTGFLGMAVVQAGVFLDSSALGEGATKVLNFRLRKRQGSDTVTGTICIKVRILSDELEMDPKSTSSLIAQVPRATSPRSMISSTHEHELLATSPGVGWQTLPESSSTDIQGSLLPAKPTTPKVVVKDNGQLEVSWDVVEEHADGLTFNLAFTTEASDLPADIWTGKAHTHQPVGLVPGKQVRFVVSATNFFGTSEYSAPSESVTISALDASAAATPDERPHCPFFMAGFCRRGDDCPLYHGSALNPDDLGAALAAVAVMGDPDMELALALQASMAETAQASYDESNQTQFKREFHRKEAAFRDKVPVANGDCNLTVTRADLFKTSFFQMIRLKGGDLRRRLMVQFQGEGGLDYGGLAREWAYLLSLEVFDPRMGMFEYCNEQDYALQVSPGSAADGDHLLFFQFVGRLLGMAILHKHFLDATFVTSFYKRILNLPITLADLQDVDPDVHRSLIWVLENDVAEIGDMTFTVDSDQMGDITTVELLPGGADKEVTEDNKREFVRLMVEWRLVKSCEKQMRGLLAGLNEVVPLQQLSIFTPKELQYLISGSQEYDLEDWKNHTEYKGYRATDEVIVWFWEVVAQMDDEDKIKFLQFCTGSSRVPLEGFQALKGSDGPRRFTIQKLDDLTRLPSAHTCFNRLDLPNYPYRAMLEERLALALRNAQGFTGD
eukprot:TRINITY_DN11527_c0_g1_i1.p1 TRINITY_DN11527_c0_g1~~TRINITY_DN11527_c0_g1_i1.p1  ORF type:complete len:940 (+),score=249.24 TRINITY_DN11527_c0_g1_i1:157-2976(+)